jgi:antitoxin protein of toxin-antitoxin system
MGLLDKAKSLLSQNKDKANTAVDKGGDMLDDKTGGKYAGQVDTAQEKAKDLIEKQNDDQA